MFFYFNKIFLHLFPITYTLLFSTPIQTPCCLHINIIFNILIVIIIKEISSNEQRQQMNLNLTTKLSIVTTEYKNFRTIRELSSRELNSYQLKKGKLGIIIIISYMKKNKNIFVFH